MSDTTPPLKFHSTVITKIGKGIIAGKSQDRTEILVAFRHEDLSEEWLSEHPNILGNPNVWVSAEDILECLGIEQYTPTAKRKLK